MAIYKGREKMAGYFTAVPGSDASGADQHWVASGDGKGEICVYLF